MSWLKPPVEPASAKRLGLMSWTHLLLLDVELAYPKILDQLPHRPIKCTFLIEKGPNGDKNRETITRIIKGFNTDSLLDWRELCDDGDSVSWPGFAGHDYVDSSTWMMPRVVDRDKRPLRTHEIKEFIRPGIKADALLRVVRKEEKGFYANLEAIRRA